MVLGIGTGVSQLAVVGLGAFVLLTISSVDLAGAWLIGAKDFVVRSFDWFFVGVANAAIVVVVILGLHPGANVRLGGDDSRPDFSRLSWFSMLFSAGLASGLLYWAAAEPIICRAIPSWSRRAASRRRLRRLAPR